MTEGEWLACTDPQEMLRFVAHDGSGPRDWSSRRIIASSRKLRLLACACHEVARQDADGTLHDEEALQATYTHADDPSQPLPFIHSRWTFAVADVERAARHAVEVNYKRAAPSLLRCLFGNPWQPPPNLVSLRWGFSDGVVLKLAQHIYDSRDFSALPILADALEEASCSNEDILNHCREPGLHGRGCWVLDLLLGKS